MSLRLTEEEYAELMARKNNESLRKLHAGDYRPPKPEHPTDRTGRESAPLTVWGPKRAKYGNRKVEIDGMKFDSQHEADYYFTNLLILYRAGRLKLLARQVPFDLPGGIKYVADFLTVDTEGNVAVIDAKSEITRRNRTYINKKKQMRAIWGIEIQEV